MQKIVQIGSLYGMPNATKIGLSCQLDRFRSPGPRHDLWDRSTIPRMHTRILESVPETEIDSEIDPEDRSQERYRRSKDRSAERS